MHWKNYGSDDDTWEPEENLVDCKEAFEEFKRQETAKAEKKAEEESKKKSLVAGQKRRRVNEIFKSKNTISSDEVSDDNTMSPKSPPAKKLLEKKPVRVKTIVSSDEDSDEKSFSPPVKSPVKKAEKKAEKKSVPKLKPENTPKSDIKLKQDTKPKEQKRVYKFMSDNEDDIGLQKTPKPEKKKIPKIAKAPKTPPKKSSALENAARFFDHDKTNSENLEAVKMKREKKRKKKDPDNGIIFSAPVSKMFQNITL